MVIKHDWKGANIRYFSKNDVMRIQTNTLEVTVDRDPFGLAVCRRSDEKLSKDLPGHSGSIGWKKGRVRAVKGVKTLRTVTP